MSFDDGLSRLERVILWQVCELQRDRKGRSISTAMLYGRVIEHANVSIGEFQSCLARLTRKALHPRA